MRQDPAGAHGASVRKESGQIRKKASPKAVRDTYFWLAKKKPPADAKPEEQVLPDGTYDGYYNDVLPSDIDREKEGLDKELIKRIAAISVGMLLIVGLCVVAIYLL